MRLRGSCLICFRPEKFRGREDASCVALADALRFLELALRAERPVCPACDKARDEGTRRFGPATLLSSRETDRGSLREFPMDRSRDIVVSDLAATPARSGKDAIPRGQEAQLAVVGWSIRGEACAHVSA